MTNTQKEKVEKGDNERNWNKAAVPLYVVLGQYEHRTVVDTHLQYHCTKQEYYNDNGTPTVGAMRHVTMAVKNSISISMYSLHLLIFYNNIYSILSNELKHPGIHITNRLFSFF